MRDDMGIAGLTVGGTILGLAILVAGVLAHDGGQVLQAAGGVVLLASVFGLAGFLARLEGPEETH